MLVGRLIPSMPADCIHVFEGYGREGISAVSPTLGAQTCCVVGREHACFEKFSMVCLKTSFVDLHRVHPALGQRSVTSGCLFARSLRIAKKKLATNAGVP